MANITISNLTQVDDAKAIADIYQNRQQTKINLLTHGIVDASVFNAGLEKMFAESIRDPDELLYVARDTDHKAVSYINLARKEAVVPLTAKARTKARADYQAAVMPGMNGPLLLQIWEKLDHMTEQAMSGRGDYWVIDNLGTLQSHQGRGIASALIHKALEVCKGKPVYLDTSGDEDGKAWPLYERMGFERVGEFEVDLSSFGGQGMHTHFGMVRDLKRLL